MLTDAEINSIIDSTIAAAAFVWRRDGQIALDLRNDFLQQWECPVERWNERCDVLIDYALRKGEGIAPHAAFEAIKVAS